MYIFDMDIKIKKILTLFLTILFITTVFAVSEVNITRFEGYSDGENIHLIWETSKEQNLKYFAVERKAANGSFVEIDQVTPEEDNYYEFIDENVYKTTSSIYIYRLSIIDKNLNKTGETKELPVTHDVTGVKRTWGSIKALFR
jgi:hypothetical protein